MTTVYRLINMCISTTGNVYHTRKEPYLEHELPIECRVEKYAVRIEDGDTQVISSPVNQKTEQNETIKLMESSKVKEINMTPRFEKIEVVSKPSTTEIRADVNDSNPLNLNESRERELPLTEPQIPLALDIPTTSLININTATVDELMSINGIGRKIAQRVVDVRDGGEYTNLDDLNKRVPLPLKGDWSIYTQSITIGN